MSVAVRRFDDFKRRLAANFLLLDRQNVNYRIPEPAGLKNMVVGSDGKASIELWPAVGTKIYYTLDGTDPRAAGGGVAPGARVYDGPLSIDSSATLLARTYEEDDGWSALVEAPFTVE